jgi:Fe(3+) dicitrate transport protein
MLFRIILNNQTHTQLSMKSHIITSLIFTNLLLFNTLNAQTDTTKGKKTYQAPEVSVTGVRSLKGMGHLNDELNCIIYAGKKTEVLLLDSIDANTAQNNPRQLLGRLPGASFSETEGSGFPSNGIGFRGVNPVQSIETNTRQNGYNISSDLFGYNEAYFLPPLNAVSRIEVVRGAASLQFGPQFGGSINYILKQAPADKLFEINMEQTAGSYGFFNSYNSIGGTYKKLSYFGYFNFSTSQGYRPNSDYRQYNGFARLQYKFNDRVTLGAEYTAMQNRIHMSGGLDDEQFAANPRASYRTRNWISTPWNIVAVTLDAKINERTSFSWKTAYMHSARNLVWRNEDGGAGTLDTIIPATGQYTEREVEREQFNNVTSEARISHHYALGKTRNTFAGGLRFYYAQLSRQGHGTGTTGTDFDLSIDSTGWGTDMRYTTVNAAPFVENIFHITPRFSVTPGFRFEYIHSSYTGYPEGYTAPVSGSRDRFLPLAGLGLQYGATSTTQLYANISQAYRPMDYDALTPLGSTAVIDPHLKDAYGFNSDLGYRGTIKNYLTFDVNAFFMLYNNTVGTETKTDSLGNEYTYRTNIASSIHAGAETYVELFPIKLFTRSDKYGQFSFYNSFSYIYAKYTEGIYKGNQVENAPQFIERFGLTYAIRSFSVTYNFSYTSRCYTDAGNTVFSPNDGTVGVIPAYMVMDISASYKFLKRFHIKAGINNITDRKYFSLRTGEYPGPGIIPAMGRSFYIGLGARF